jgi:hypothetical protein
MMIYGRVPEDAMRSIVSIRRDLVIPTIVINVLL